jgi:TnpA family transposase
LPTSEQKAKLETLLEVPEGHRTSRLDFYKKGPVTISSPAFNEAIDRHKGLKAFNMQSLDFSRIPPVRLKNLGRHVGMITAYNIARMPEEKRIAILVAFVKTFEITALDVLDLLITDVAGKAKNAGQKNRLRTLKDLDKSALVLAEVCALILNEETKDNKLRETIFSKMPKDKLKESISLVNSLARPFDDNFHDEMMEQYCRVRRFLPRLLNDIEFKAAPAGKATLDAFNYLGSLRTLTMQFLKNVPLGIITNQWKRLVFDKESLVTKRGYILCFLNNLQDSLRRRDVYVEKSDRWGDPRKKLLQGIDWQANRIQVCRSLGHPVNPQEAISSLSQSLDIAYKQVADNFNNNNAVKLDFSGKHPSLTITNLEKLDEPPSLTKLNKQVTELLPKVDLTELLLEIHAHTGFADEFTHVSTSNSRADDLTVSICAVLLSEACNFVSDQYSGFHGIVIPGTMRDSIFVLEGLLEQQTGLNPTEIMTDTSGASDMVFGLFWLLGYQFSPRLADAGEAVFWRVDKSANYGVLNDLARGCVNTHRIEQHWDDMLRVAGSLKLGTIQASELVRSLLKSERPSSLAHAIMDVGRINKTLYLLNYIDNEDYRRRILTQLNRGEGRHAVARAICYGQRCEIRKRYREGQEDQLGALGLITNALALWNTIYMQASLDHLKKQSIEIKIEDEARLSPLVNRHINMLGHYTFTLAENVINGALRPLNQSFELDEIP